MPDQVYTNWPGRDGGEDIYHPDKIFLTVDPSKAAFHAVQSTGAIKHTAPSGNPGGHPVILEIEVPDPSRLLPDYDVDRMSKGGPTTLPGYQHSYS